MGMKKVWVPRNAFSVVQQPADAAELAAGGVRNTFPEWEFPLLEGGEVRNFSEKNVSR
jgi:hypothetical protein